MSPVTLSFTLLPSSIFSPMFRSPFDSRFNFPIPAPNAEAIAETPRAPGTDARAHRSSRDFSCVLLCLPPLVRFPHHSFRGTLPARPTVVVHLVLRQPPLAVLHAPVVAHTPRGVFPAS